MSSATAAGEGHRGGPAAVCGAEDSGLIVWAEAPGGLSKAVKHYWLLRKLHAEWIAAGAGMEGGQTSGGASR